MQEITLANLPEKTPQQVFDYVCKHLLTQNAKAVCDGISASCKYLTDKGLRCAAGCLIAPEEYKSSMENERWDILANRGVVPIEHRDLIRSMQYVHDDSAPEHWVRQLLYIAEKYQLNPDVLKITKEPNQNVPVSELQ